MGKKDEFANLDLITAYGKNSKTEKEILLSEIFPNPKQPRIFGRDKVDDLLPSMGSDGLIEPIVLRKKSKNHYIIIAGERRYQAAKKLNWEKIPSVVLDVDEEKSFELSLIENEKRKNLNPWEVGKAIASIREEQGKTVKQVSEIFGYTERYIKQLSRIAKLEQEEVSKMIEDNTDLSIKNLETRLKIVSGEISQNQKDELSNMFKTKITLNIKKLDEEQKQSFFHDLEILKKKYKL